MTNSVKKKVSVGEKATHSTMVSNLSAISEDLLALVASCEGEIPTDSDELKALDLRVLNTLSRLHTRCSHLVKYSAKQLIFPGDTIMVPFVEGGVKYVYPLRVESVNEVRATAVYYYENGREERYTVKFSGIDEVISGSAKNMVDRVAELAAEGKACNFEDPVYVQALMEKGNGKISSRKF